MDEIFRDDFETRELLNEVPDYIMDDTEAADEFDEILDDMFSVPAYETCDHFDENTDDASEVNEDIHGNPSEAMEEWEFQGDTNRCALYSQKFIIDEFTGVDHDIEEIVSAAEENGWFTETGGTQLDDVNKMLDYYQIDNEIKPFSTMDEVNECLDQGGRVIAEVKAEDIWYGDNEFLYSPGDMPNHALEIIGTDYSDPNNPKVILNDSGIPNGKGIEVPMETFENACQESGNTMIFCYR